MVKLVRVEAEREELIKGYLYPFLIIGAYEKFFWSKYAYDMYYEQKIEDERFRSFDVIKDDKSIGALVLKNIDFENRNAMLTISLYDPTDIPMSVEVLNAVIESVFNRFDLKKLYGLMSSLSKYNSIIEEAGFKKEGCLEKSLFNCGEFQDQFVFSRFKSDIGELR